MKIVCFGDSLTFGKVGYSYVKYLKKTNKVRNRGVNGDTTICMYHRLKRYLGRRSKNDKETYVIEIGINDLLLPYLTTVSLLWRIQMTSRVKWKKCILHSKDFEVEYEEMIRMLLDADKKMIAVGIPFLQLDHFPNNKVQERNLIIQGLAKRYNVPFIDVTKIQMQLEFGNENEVCYSYTWRRKNLLVLMDGIIMTVFPWSKRWLVKWRGLDLTVDGVHFSSKMARAVAKEIEICLPTD